MSMLLDETKLVAAARDMLVPAIARELGPILKATVAELGPALTEALDGLVVTITVTKKPAMQLGENS
jgi:hypothetical protein